MSTTIETRTWNIVDMSAAKFVDSWSFPVFPRLIRTDFGFLEGLAKELGLETEQAAEEDLIGDVADHLSELASDCNWDDDETPYNITAGCIYVSEEVFHEEAFSQLVDAIRDKQKELGFPESTVQVLRENNMFELC